jgi:prepilin-type N-terminal cleavage/methylation domain-containing protein/prepilin-type processing-associated H-X9-DG protein
VTRPSHIGSALRTTPRRKAFTLIELLVVIAIIGILAAMLFPVFARARESARKTQCLANVKNIAMGYQIYLSDYDRFPPSEHRAEVIDYFNGGGPHEGCGCGGGRSCCTDRISQANPYLKVPVILDEYVKSREIWKCPSAPTQQTFQIMDTYLNSKGTDDWFLRFQEMESNCPRFKSCDSPLPSGWGGAVTDSLTNHVWCTPALGSGAFEQSYGTPTSYYDLSTSAINDPAKHVVVADGGVSKACMFENTSNLAYPDTCRLARAANSADCGGDWVNCSQSRTCSPFATDHGGDGWKAGTDAQYRKSHWPGRHLGGENLGFADGHAKWMNSEAILFGGPVNWKNIGTGDLEGLDTCICTVKGF